MAIASLNQAYVDEHTTNSMGCWQRITWRPGRKHCTFCTSSPMINWPLRWPAL